MLRFITLPEFSRSTNEARNERDPIDCQGLSRVKPLPLRVTVPLPPPGYATDHNKYLFTEYGSI